MQPSSFSSYCRKNGVKESQMRQILKDEFQPIKTLPGYCNIGMLCSRIYYDFKSLCASGRQPGSFTAYYRKHGITSKQMVGFQWRNKLKVAGLPGFKGPPGTSTPHGQEIPFEDVIFEESGFLPAGGANVISVKVDGQVVVSFPADTDPAVVAKFVQRIGKGGSHVES
ncbi:hypothetical protein VCM39_03950 [Bacteroides sp. CG01]|nr:hypothetical protein [Bacteroides sp. CG01]